MAGKLPIRFGFDERGMVLYRSDAPWADPMCVVPHVTQDTPITADMLCDALNALIDEVNDAD